MSTENQGKTGTIRDEKGRFIKGVSGNLAGKPVGATETEKSLVKKVWKEVLENYLPDDLLVGVHKEGLSATRIHGTNDDFIEIPDFATRHKYLETAYKVKSKIPKDANVTAVQINFNDDREKFS